jgi:hypothetical protein
VIALQACLFSYATSRLGASGLKLFGINKN